MGEIAEALGKVAGKNIRVVEVVTEALSLEARRANPILDSHLSLNETAVGGLMNSSGEENTKELGIQMTGFQEYLEGRKDEIVKGFEGPGSETDRRIRMMSAFIYTSLKRHL